jgi:hypothetical protein
VKEKERKREKKNERKTGINKVFPEEHSLPFPPHRFVVLHTHYHYHCFISIL